jgi:hypothetical protein
MTQHVTIIATDRVDPYLAHVWRDDQTIMWGLAGNLAWPPDEPYPIQFLPGDGQYAEWPGTPPVPVGTPPPAGQPDQRYYMALCNDINNGTKSIFYHYKLIVTDLASGETKRVRVYDEVRKGWYDPDIGNSPVP